MALIELCQVKQPSARKKSNKLPEKYISPVHIRCQENIKKHQVNLLIDFVFHILYYDVYLLVVEYDHEKLSL